MRLMTFPTVLALLSLTAVLTAAVPARAQDAQALSQRLERLERDIQTLSKMVVRGPGAVPAADLPAAAKPAEPMPNLPQNAVARIGVRLDTLESELRDVTGRIEEMTYNIDQLTARVDRLVADVDFRLSGLEQQGRVPGTASAVQPGAAGPQANAAPTPGEVRMIGRPAGTLGQIDPNLVKSTEPGAAKAAPSGVGGPVEASPMQPPAGAPNPAGVTRVQPPQQTAAVSQGNTTSGPVLPDGTAEEQYKFAFDLLRKHQFDQAEMAFKEFLGKHEGGGLAGNARYWLGETHYARAEYVKAAEVFLQGFEKDPKGGKAPDSLLKLAMSLGQLGQNKEGCAAIDKLFVDFPNANSSLKRTATRQQRQMNCKQ
ncbi:MAG: tol-pal system protein YbgF [Rhodospirillales bacterium]